MGLGEIDLPSTCEALDPIPIINNLDINSSGYRLPQPNLWIPKDHVWKVLSQPVVSLGFRGRAYRVLERGKASPASSLIPFHVQTTTRWTGSCHMLPSDIIQTCQTPKAMGPTTTEARDHAP